MINKLSNTDQVIYQRLKRHCDNCRTNFQCAQPHDEVVGGVQYHKPVIRETKYGTARLEFELCGRAYQ